MSHEAIKTRSILVLHGIGTPRRVLEPGEAQYWLSRDMFCQILDRVLDLGEDAPDVTFDDGNVSDLEVAVPELDARNLAATFFVLTGRLGCEGSLTDQDVRTIAGSGHRIGLHGHDHRDWRKLDDAGRRTEYRIARTRLSDLSGTKIDLAAAPFGYYNRQVVCDLVGEGFKALHTSDWGRAAETRFIQPRNCLDNAMTMSDLDHAIAGHVKVARRPRRLAGIARKRLLPIRLAS